MGIGLMLLRIAAGGALALQGWAKLTRSGRRSTTAFFAEVGFAPAAPLALIAGLTEVGAGTLLIVGAATPLAAAGAAGVLASAAVVSWRNGYWNVAGGAEYALVLGFTAAALAFTGPGAASIDNLLGLAEPHAAIAAGCVLLGLLMSAPLLIARARRLRRARVELDENLPQAA